MGNCQDCKWWATGYSEWGKRYGTCNAIVPYYKVDDPIAMPISGAYAESDPSFETRDDFGCVLFKAK